MSNIFNKSTIASNIAAYYNMNELKDYSGNRLLRSLWKREKLITLSKLPFPGLGDLLKLPKTDYIIRLITLSIIPSSRVYCISIFQYFILISRYSFGPASLLISTRNAKNDWPDKLFSSKLCAEDTLPGNKPKNLR